MKPNEFSISERIGKIKGFIEKQHGFLFAMIWGGEEGRKQKAEEERVCDLQLLAEDKIVQGIVLTQDITSSC